MARVHVETDARTGKITEVPFTDQEEIDADAAEAAAAAAPPPRDLLAELDALKTDLLESKKASAALVAKGVITQADIDAQKVELVAADAAVAAEAKIG